MERHRRVRGNACVTVSAMPGFELSPGGSMGFSGRVGQQPAPVPLPAGIWLPGSGLMGLAALRRRIAGRLQVAAISSSQN